MSPIASIDDAIKPINTSNGVVANRTVVNRHAAKTPADVAYAAD